MIEGWYENSLTDWRVELVSMTADIATHSCLLNLQFALRKVEVGSKFDRHVTKLDHPMSVSVNALDAMTAL